MLGLLGLAPEVAPRAEGIEPLATGLQQAIIGLDEARSACLKYGFLDPQSRLTIRNPAGAIPSEIEDALARSRDLIGHVRARSARISLLFGPVSAPDRLSSRGLTVSGGYPYLSRRAMTRRRLSSRGSKGRLIPLQEPTSAGSGVTRSASRLTSQAAASSSSSRSAW